MEGVCFSQLFMVLVYEQERHLQQKTVKENLQMSLEQRSQMNLSRGVQILNGFVEGDFDTYVAQMRQPHVWGGEPELLMSSHVFQRNCGYFVLNPLFGNRKKGADVEFLSHIFEDDTLTGLNMLL